MSVSRSHIGMRLPPCAMEVERGHLRFFAKAVHETDPIYFDDEAARRAGHPAMLAPPTFVLSLYLAAQSLHGNMSEMLGIDLNRILHGEQAFRYHHPIYAGDRITLERIVSDIYEKKQGALEFVVIDTLATNQHAQLCTEMRVVTIVRSGTGVVA